MTPSVSLDIAIELIIPDNTAHTVLVALRKLGYDRLVSVQRADHLELVTAPGAPQPERIVEQLSRAEILFNPNKHRLSYALLPPASSEAQFEALVRDKHDDVERLVGLLQHTFSMPYVTGLKRGVLWRLHDDGGSASPERLEWSCRTLLSNSVSQTYQISAKPARVEFREPARPAANS